MQGSRKTTVDDVSELQLADFKDMMNTLASDSNFGIGTPMQQTFPSIPEFQYFAFPSQTSYHEDLR